MIVIRSAQHVDWTYITDVIESAFSDEESPVILTLAHDFSTKNNSASIKPLVAELNGKIVGYICYSPIEMTSSSNVSGFILAPLAVSLEYQKQGIGSKLIQYGIEMLSKEGADVLLVYGDPNYYGRFGFTESVGRAFIPPYPLAYPFGWTGMMLNTTKLPHPAEGFSCVDALANPEMW